jgi:hypothetical protein
MSTQMLGMGEASLHSLQFFKGAEDSSGPDGMIQPITLFSAQLTARCSDALKMFPAPDHR